VPAPAAGPRTRACRAGSAQTADALWPWWMWPLMLAAVLACSIWFVHWSGMRPSFDPFGWLTWGHQIIYGRVDLNAAPSWKPLTAVFTVPFALFGGTAVSMWSVTATAGTLLMGVFAGRVAYRVTGAGPDSSNWVRVAAWIGALFAAVGVLGMAGLPKLTYIANSDQLNTALVLAAIDAHFSRRPRLAYVALFFAALGRPEVYALIGLYGLWMIWKVPGSWTLVIGGWILVIAAWYVPQYFWAASLNEASKLDLNKASACTGNKALCVIRRGGPDLYAWPMLVAALIGAVVGIARRNVAIVVLIGAALVWTVVEIAFAYDGLSAVSRYIMEATSLIVVVAGYGVYSLMAGLPGLLDRLPAVAMRVGGTIVVIVFLIGSAHSAHVRLFKWKNGADHARAEGIVNKNLSRAVTAAGGPAHLLACGKPAALNDHQSQLAWALQVNDAHVLYNPPLLRHLKSNVVLFLQRHNGWNVQAINVPSSAPSYCSTLDKTFF
jgi:hypothetical protein